MANLFVAYDNHLDDATLSGGAWETTLPLNNLKDQQPSKVARTTNDAASSTQFTADLGSRKNINVISLIHHNLSNAATWRVRISNAADFATTVVDTGTVDVVDAIEAYGELDWGAFTWGGKPSNAVLAEFNPIAFYFNNDGALGQYVKIEITDTANGDEYIEMGRAYIATAFIPTDNVAYGVTASFVDDSRSVMSRGGQVYVDTVPKRRRFGFTFHSMNEAEAYTQANEIQRQKGLSGDVLMALDVDDATNRMRQSAYGRIVDLQPVVHQSVNHFTMAMQIEELL